MGGHASNMLPEGGGERDEVLRGWGSFKFRLIVWDVLRKESLLDPVINQGTGCLAQQ